MGVEKREGRVWVVLTKVINNMNRGRSRSRSRFMDVPTSESRRLRSLGGPWPKRT